jgi:hypothetical protein
LKWAIQARNTTVQELATAFVARVDRLLQASGVGARLLLRSFSPWTSDPFDTTQPASVLTSLREWGRDSNIDGSLPHDAMLLLVSNSLGGNQGLSFSNTQICRAVDLMSTYSVARILNDSTVPSGAEWALAAAVATNMLARNLGVVNLDDSPAAGCGNASTLLMRAEVGPASSRWSNCSTLQLREALASAFCLLNRDERNTTLLSCGSGFFAPADAASPVNESLCAPCSVNCTECRGDNSTCTRCPAPLFVLDGACAPRCPMGTFRVVVDASVPSALAAQSPECRSCLLAAPPGAPNCSAQQQGLVLGCFQDSGAGPYRCVPATCEEYPCTSASSPILDTGGITGLAVGVGVALLLVAACIIAWRKRASEAPPSEADVMAAAAATEPRTPLDVMRAKHRNSAMRPAVLRKEAVVRIEIEVDLDEAINEEEEEEEEEEDLVPESGGDANRDGSSRSGAPAQRRRSSATKGGHARAVSQSQPSVSQGGISLPASESSEARGLTASASLPSGWSEHIDEKTGAFYYHNDSTGEVRWERPK